MALSIAFSQIFPKSAIPCLVSGQADVSALEIALE
jgi:hypothetical protein